MNPHEDTYRYWFAHEVAMETAHILARETGVRQRVQRCRWRGSPVLGARWFIAPTPAPAPKAVS